jgi:hypothetical protein
VGSTAELKQGAAGVPSEAYRKKGSAMRAHHVFLVAVALSLPFVPAPAAEVGGTRVAERTVKALSSIQWAGDLDQVLEKAKTEKKLVFWLQIVGDLAGGL